ncbi:MAG: DUF6893 family small protein [Thermodesulfobacteriota bacterium]
MENKKKSWWNTIGGAVTIIAIIGVTVLLPDIRRYMRIRSM